MIRVYPAILAACSIVCLAGATNARPGEPIYEWPGFHWEPADQHLYEGIRDYAQCVIQVEPRQVEALLALPIGLPRQRELYLKLVEDGQRCATLIAVRMDPRVYRGALIEALYRQDFQRSKAGKATVHLGNAAETLKLAKCLTRADEKTAERLLLTRPASPQQAQMFAQLSPVFQACHGAGVTPGDPQILRYEIAEALYRQRSGDESIRETAK